MKKVLFATTALVATAGVAAADVTFGGYGRFGAIYTESKGVAGTATNATQISSAQSALSSAQTALATATSAYNASVAAGTATGGQLIAVQDAQAGVDAAAASLAALQGVASDDGVDIESRYRLIITATTESDVGVTFGATTASTPHVSLHVPATLKSVLVTSSALWNTCPVSTSSTWV